MTLSEWLREVPERSVSEHWCSGDGDYAAFANVGNAVVREAHSDTPAVARAELLRRMNLAED